MEKRDHASPAFDVLYERHPGMAETFNQYPELKDQLAGSLQKLQDRIQTDEAFRDALKVDPQSITLAFMEAEMAEYELSERTLEAIAGGLKIPNADSTAGYDIGYFVGSIYERFTSC